MLPNKTRISLTPQQQPTSVSCMHTCVAMLVGLPVVDLAEDNLLDLHESLSDEDAAKLLVKYDIIPTFRNGSVFYGNVYLLCVPSLNMHKMNHAILLDLRDEDNPVVIDPNEGKEGKEVYTSADFPKIPWSIVFRVGHICDRNFSVYGN